MATDALIRVVLQGDEAVSGAQRVSQALARLERNEPTFAMRQMRLAIDDLAVSATGLDPRLARLTATLAQFGIGGTAGLVAIAGFAAIAVEARNLAKQADEVEAKLFKLNTTIAAGGRAAALFRAQDFARQAEELPGRGFLNIHRGFFRSLSPEALAAGDIQEASQRADLLQQEMMSLAEFDRQHRAIIEAANKKEAERTRAIETATIAVERAMLGAHATAAQLEVFAAREDRLRIATLDLTDAQRRRLEALDAEKRALDRLNEAGGQAAVRALQTYTTAHGYGPAYTGDLTTGLFAGRPFVTPTMTPITTPLRLAVGLRGGPPQPVREENVPGYTGMQYRPDETTGGFDAIAVMAALGSLSGVRGGGAAGAVGGLGGALMSLASSKTLGLAALGPIGQAFSVGSGLLSLFGGGGNKLHVTIDSYTQQAIEQMKVLRADPLTRDVILVNSNDPRQTLYQSGRLGRRDATPRGA